LKKTYETVESTAVNIKRMTARGWLCKHFYELLARLDGLSINQGYKSTNIIPAVGHRSAAHAMVRQNHQHQVIGVTDVDGRM
jgi:hypothetical protein